MSDLAEDVLGRAISGTRVAEVLRNSREGDSVKVLFRVVQKRTWLSVLEYVMPRASLWTAHVCQQYFMRGPKLVYGWNFILRPNDGVSAEDAVKQAAALLAHGARVAPQVTPGPPDSFPLVGASPRRTAKIAFDPRLPGPGGGGPSHKGAYYIGSDK